MGPSTSPSADAGCTGTCGTFALGVLPTTTINYGSEGWKSTGLQVDSGYRYQLRVTGSVTASPNSELGCYSSINWSTVPDLGTYGPGQPGSYGSAGGYLGVTLAIDTMPEQWRIGMGTTTDGSAWETGINTTGRTITIFARRNNGPPAGTNCASSPPGGGFYALAGSSTISVMVLPPLPPDSLLMSRTPSGNVNAGMSVTFTATHTQSQTRIDRWEWYPDSIPGKPMTLAFSLCQDQQTCNYTPQFSGTMHVVDAGGLRAKEHIDVITCPWNEPIIDQPQVRQQLADEFKISDSTKVERGGAIYQVDGAVPAQYIVYYATKPTPPATDCSNNYSVGIVQGWTLLAMWHTHPLSAGIPFRTCLDGNSGDVAVRGPSRQDYDKQEKLPWSIPQFVIDHEDVFRVLPHNGVGGRSAATKDRPWRSCSGWTTIVPQ